MRTAITLKLVDVEVRVEGRFACENARTVLTMAGGRTVLGRGAMAEAEELGMS